MHCWKRSGQNILKNTNVGNKIRRTIWIKRRYSTFEKGPLVFSGQNQNKYTGALVCVLCRAHIFKCQSINSWRKVFNAWRQAGPVHGAVESAKRCVCFCTKSNSINGFRLARSNRATKQDSRCLQCTKCTTLTLLVLNRNSY